MTENSKILMPGNTRKGVIETPELDGRTWTEFPE